MAELNLLYVNSMGMGYGRMGVMLARELEKLGVEIYDDLPTTIPQKSAKLPADHERDPKVCNTKLWVSTPAHCYGVWGGQSLNLFSMWETMNLPETFRANMHEFETILVPSRQNVELFGEFHPNVKFVPLGVDPEVWHYVPRKEPTNRFNFMIAGSGPRKGIDLAVAAFEKTFGRRRRAEWPWPHLVVKSPRGESCYGHRIEIVSGRLTDQEEVELYEDAHCYLGPARGEGFGLQPLQAIAQGCPTILTDAHGHESFAHLGWGIGAKPAKASYFVYGESGDWWEPSRDDLCDQMRWVYDNYEAACERASTAATVVAKEWTWQKTAEKTILALGREKLNLPYAGSGEWRELEQKRYLVVTNRDFVANAVGATYRFEAGKEYYETPGVKSILFEAGILSPACLTQEDTGLPQEQAESLSAARQYCPTCTQRLNSGRTKADDLFEEYERAAAES